jgi:putative chitinase
VAFIRFGMTTPARIAAFLAQTAEESQGYTRVEENLFYNAARLVLIWPNHFQSIASASTYEHNPEKLANCVYANRLGNGNEASGDGWTYRGRGLLQITGRANYRACGAGIAIALEQHPELLSTPTVAALSAAQFWASRGLNALADVNDFIGMTKVINGGTNGLLARQEYWERAKAAFA